MVNSATRILWVEDYEDLTESLGEVLRLRGFLLQILPSTEKFMATIEAFRPDLILVDVKLNDQTRGGFELLAELQKSAYASIPVVVFSGYILPDYEAEALRLGARSYLLKPVSVSVLVNEIYRALANWLSLVQ